MRVDVVFNRALLAKTGKGWRIKNNIHKIQHAARFKLELITSSVVISWDTKHCAKFVQRENMGAWAVMPLLMVLIQTAACRRHCPGFSSAPGALLRGPFNFSLFCFPTIRPN